jgi:hypothetical protein
MRTSTLLFAVATVSGWGRLGALNKLFTRNEGLKSTKTIFDFDVPRTSGQPVSLSEFKGKKAYLIVNVASK